RWRGRGDWGPPPGPACSRVPRPPARMTTSRPASPSGVPIRARPEDLVDADQLPDPVVQGVPRLAPPILDLLVGDDVVALVRVLADGRLEEREARDVDLDPLAELLL